MAHGSSISSTLQTAGTSLRGLLDAVAVVLDDDALVNLTFFKSPVVAGVDDGVDELRERVERVAGTGVSAE